MINPFDLEAKILTLKRITQDLKEDIKEMMAVPESEKHKYFMLALDRIEDIERRIDTFVQEFHEFIRQCSFQKQE